MSHYELRLGKTNQIKSNAPEGAPPQSNIIVYRGGKELTIDKDGKPTEKYKGKSGWEIWKQDGYYYHLGGHPKRREPVIYKLTDKGWSSKCDQSTAWARYNLLNKQSSIATH